MVGESETGFDGGVAGESGGSIGRVFEVGVATEVRVGSEANVEEVESVGGVASVGGVEFVKGPGEEDKARRLFKSEDKLLIWAATTSSTVPRPLLESRTSTSFLLCCDPGISVPHPALESALFSDSAMLL